MTKSISAFFIFILSTFAFSQEAVDLYKPIKVTASNTLIEDKNNPQKYGAENLVDGSWKSWAGKGVGTTFTFEFAEEIPISQIAIRNGYGNLGYYLKNNRVKSVKITSNGEYLCSTHLKDTPDPQWLFYRKDAIKVKSITIEILGIYPGTQFDDTCISEITFFYFGELETNIREFKYDSWRSNVFSTLYKHYSKKTKTDRYGRCLVYALDDFEGTEGWHCVHENLYAAVFPHGYRGMGKWYSIFPQEEGALVVEYEKEDLTDIDLHLYTYNGKTLTDVTNGELFRPIADTINEMKKQDFHSIRYYPSFGEGFQLNFYLKDDVVTKTLKFDGKKFVKPE